MTPGSSVRITSKCTANGRTGVVTGPSNFEEGWLRVELDPRPPFPTWGLFPPGELQPIAAGERIAAPTQASLFGGVS